MVDINEIKAGRINDIETAVAVFLSEKIGKKQVYHVTNEKNLHVKSYIVMNNGSVIMKVFETYIVVSTCYLDERYGKLFVNDKGFKDKKEITLFDYKICYLVMSLISQFLIDEYFSDEYLLDTSECDDLLDIVKMQQQL